MGNCIEVFVGLVVAHLQVMGFQPISFQQEQFLGLEEKQIREIQTIKIGRVQIFDVVLQIIGQIAEKPIAGMLSILRQVVKCIAAVGPDGRQGINGKHRIKRSIGLRKIIAVQENDFAELLCPCQEFLLECAGVVYMSGYGSPQIEIRKAQN